MAKGKLLMGHEDLGLARDLTALFIYDQCRRVSRDAHYLHRHCSIHQSCLQFSMSFTDKNNWRGIQMGVKRIWLILSARNSEASFDYLLSFVWACTTYITVLIRVRRRPEFSEAKTHQLFRYYECIRYQSDFTNRAKAFYNLSIKAQGQALVSLDVYGGRSSNDC